jgi:Ni/Co efflux regulator RcnB
MRIGRLVLTALFGTLLAATPISSSGWGDSEASAGKSKSSSQRSSKSSSKKRSKKKRASKKAQNKRAKSKRVARKARKARKGKRSKRSYFRGHGVAKDQLRADAVPRPSGDLWIYSANVRQELKVNIYADDGGPEGEPRFDEAVLAQLDQVFRCKRTGEQRAVDPRLYQTLSVIADHYGQKRIELVSGFRFQENEGSRHYHAAAADIRIEGVSNRELYKYVESLDAGGMGIGIYPRAGFVHVDFRAPGEPSYRWTDRSPPEPGAKGKRPSRRWRSGRPSS